jgi:hypothetical protein
LSLISILAPAANTDELSPWRPEAAAVAITVAFAAAATAATVIVVVIAAVIATAGGLAAAVAAGGCGWRLLQLCACGTAVAAFRGSSATERERWWRQR